MKIYRLEHRDTGLGLWTGGHFDLNNKACERINNRCFSNKTHPNIFIEFGREQAYKAIDNKWLCATHSLSQLYAWFEYDWIELDNFALFEIEIEMGNCLIGKTQLMFDLQAIISKREISFEEYKEALK